MRCTVAVLTLACGTIVGAGAQTSIEKPRSYKGLEVTATAVDYESSAMLSDCPPGTNTVKAMTRPGEQMAVVSAAFKVLPGFQPLIIKRPVATAADGKSYNTSASFVDIGTVQEFSCQFAFRVPVGTKLKTFSIETMSIDVTAIGSKK